MGKYCIECGTRLSVRAKFCPECGADQRSDISISIGRDVGGDMNVAGRDIIKIGSESEKIPCPVCRGAGKNAICFNCGGTGRQTVHVELTRYGEEIKREETCRICKGAGIILWSGTRFTENTVPCDNCKGLGWIRA
jgi:hypothetical protein